MKIHVNERSLTPSQPERPVSVSDAALSIFFARMTDLAEEAAGRLGEHAHDLTIAGRPARIRFAGGALTSLMRPLAHLVPKADEVSPLRIYRGEIDSPLEILVFDSFTSGRVPPPPPWSFQNLSYLGEITSVRSEEFSVNFTGEYCLLSMFHRPTNRAIYWIANPHDLPFWEIAAPFRILFHWWSQSFGGQIAHAAAVGRDGEGVLLVGRGGSGKSTTSVLCLDEGLDFVGDDYVLLTHEPRPTAHSLFNSAKVHTRFLEDKLPHWNSRVARRIGPEAKSVFFLHESRPEVLRRKLAIRAVVQPRVTSAASARLLPQSPSLALLGAAPSTMYQLPNARSSSLSFLAEFIKEVPSYLLHLGTNLSSGPQQLLRLLSKENARRAA